MNSIPVFISFSTILLLVVLSINAGIGFSLVHFFGPTKKIRIIIWTVIVILSPSFFATSMIAHYYDNPFTRGFYLVASIGLSVLFYSFIFFILAWITVLGFRIFRRDIPFVRLGQIVIIATVLVNVYGLYNASRVIVRNETVYIKNLPSAWEGKNIVQVTDVHLGHILRTSSLQRVVDAINTTNPTIVCFVGDFFDGMDGHLSSLIAPLQDIRSEKGMYFVTGNHEVYLGTGEVFEAFSGTQMNILDNQQVNIDGLTLLGISSPARGMQTDIPPVLQEMQFDQTKPSVLLYHVPTNLGEIQAAGINLQLSGHTHRGQLYPFNFITSLVFGGYDFGLFHDDNYTLSASSGAGTWGPPIRTSGSSEIVVLTLRTSGSQQ